MCLTTIQMPGGGIEDVDPSGLWWMRTAFDWEVENTVMLQFNDRKLYSSQSLPSLKQLFTRDGVTLVEFTAPDSEISPVVNGGAVKKVVPADDNHHDNSGAILMFSRTVGLAVRESVDEARKKLAGIVLIS